MSTPRGAMRLTFDKYSVVLVDDGYRICVQDYQGPAKSDRLAEMDELLMEYKHFNWPGIGGEIVDRIWNSLLASGGVSVDDDDAARVDAWGAKDCEYSWLHRDHPEQTPCLARMYEWNKVPVQCILVEGHPDNHTDGCITWGPS